MTAERSLRTYSGAVALITGGGSGIGAALGRALAGRGATVLLADRHGESAERAAAAIRQGGGSAEAAELDVRDAAAMEAQVAGAFLRHGRLDYLFNNAGIAVGGDLLDCKLDDWRHIVEVNLMGVVHGIQAAYPRMVQQGFGHIVNTASMAGLSATPFTTPYCATKHAVVGLSRSLRIEAQPHRVRVSVLCPGAIRTPILEGGRFGRMATPVPPEALRAFWDGLRPMDVDRFAACALEQVAQDRGIIILPAWWRAMFFLSRLSPAVADALSARMFRRVRAGFEKAR